jgi:hypothetical protein
MSNGFNDTAINYRVGSVATNAVKAMREVYGRDDLPFLDADTAAIKTIELILADLPRSSEYADLEAKPMVSATQPKPNKALAKINGMLAKELEDFAAGAA